MTMFNVTASNAQDWRIRLAAADELLELVNQELAEFQAGVDRIGLDLR